MSKLYKAILVHLDDDGKYAIITTYRASTIATGNATYDTICCFVMKIISLAIESAGLRNAKTLVKQAKKPGAPSNAHATREECKTSSRSKDMSEDKGKSYFHEAPAGGAVPSK